MNLEARVKFEKRIDEAAKKAVYVLLRDGDPVEGRARLRALLRKVAREAAATPDMFDLAEEK